MPYRDFRDFLEKLGKEEELAQIKAEVDIKYELGAICRKSVDAYGPGLLFENPKGYNIPVAINILSTRERCALALESTSEKIVDDWLERIKKGPLEPRLVKTGPCKENIIIGDDVNLWKFPIPLFNEKDGGHFVTAGIQISRDPEEGWRNSGIYRMMIHDEKTMGLSVGRYQHLWLQYRKAEAKDKRFPVAVAIGVDPVIFITAATPFAWSIDEIAMAGALRTSPVDMVECETIPLEVPSSAEIVIEGEVLPRVRRREGPFGEVTGYYGPAGDKLVFEVKTITHRDNPIFHASYTGRPILENQVTKSIAGEAEIMRTCPLSGLRKVYLKESGCCFICIAQIEKSFDGQGKWFGNAILGTEPGYEVKYLIIVDTDIDPFDPSQVDWALATRSQPIKDTWVIPNITGMSLDPSIQEGKPEVGRLLTSKMVIDATKPLEFAEEALPPKEVVSKVEAQWDKYGIELSKNNPKESSLERSRR